MSVPSAFHAAPFQIDHIIARQHGGKTELENLALACIHCNRFKGPNVAGLDPESREIVRLFHPRRDSWADHFVWDGPELKARTQMGRVTIAVLVINDPEIVAVRSVTRRGSFVALATRTDPRFPSAYSGGAGRRVAAIMRRGSDLPTCHCLLPHRRDRRAYVSECD
jgi:hypothetical protein